MKKPLKAFIGIEIDGITRIAHWDEATKDRYDYSCFDEQMTNEAVARRLY